jgi:hypothetical protein
VQSAAGFFKVGRTCASVSSPPQLLLATTLGIAMCMMIFFVPGANAANYKIQQWQAVEIQLTSAVTYADPFQDVDVTATFTSPGNKEVIRPAFWDGGTTWKVRFAPPQTGLWTMTTSATDIKNGGLHHVTKTVRCDRYSGNLDIYKHRFLKVSSSGRYMTYADGTPFLYLGDTHWILSHERFETSNAPGVASQFKYTVDKRVERKSGSLMTELPMKKLTQTSHTALLPLTWPASQISTVSSSTLRTTAWYMPMPKSAGWEIQPHFRFLLKRLWRGSQNIG